MFHVTATFQKSTIFHIIYPLITWSKAFLKGRVICHKGGQAPVGLNCSKKDLCLALGKQF